MITDYKTRESRMMDIENTKKKIFQTPDADFRLADNDDFFGFDSKQEGLTLTQLILSIVIGLPVLYGIVYVLLTLTPNIYESWRYI